MEVGSSFELWTAVDRRDRFPIDLRRTASDDENASAFGKPSGGRIACVPAPLDHLRAGFPTPVVEAVDLWRANVLPDGVADDQNTTVSHFCDGGVRSRERLARVP